MKYSKLIIFSISNILLIVCSAEVNAQIRNNAEDPITNSIIEKTESSFVIFDGTSFDDQSEILTQAGLTPIDIAYQVHLWGKSHKQLKNTDPWGLPPRNRLIEQALQARTINPEIAILDIEHWPVERSEENWERSLQNYITVVEKFKKSQPELKVGYYDIVPHKNWYAYPKQQTLNKWRAANDLLGPLAEKVDVFFPSLYAYKKDQKYWVASAKLLLKEARRVGGGKPVYAFLWPQYLSKGNDNLRGEYISADFWRLQLETVRKYADGAVIWFPYDTDWQEASKGPWWETTKKFLSDISE